MLSILDRTDWRDAHLALHQRGIGSLDLAALEDRAEACFWMCEPQEWLDARRRAYAVRRDNGDIEQAILHCWHLFTGHHDLGESALAGSWATRAAEHAADVPDSVAAGYAALAQAEWAWYNAMPEDAHTFLDTSLSLATKNHHRELRALAQVTRGRFLVHGGNVAAGVSELDTAMLAAASEELDRFTTGRVYCVLVSTCHEMGDVRRAGEWTSTAVQWCESLGEDSWYPGLCRLHRCELDSLRGEWSKAEREAQMAATDLAPFGSYWVGESLYLVGEIRRHRGDAAGAENAYAQAHQHGREPLPGMALARAEKGDAPGAEKLLARALASGGAGPLRTAHLLAAHTTVALDAGNQLAAARSAEKLRAVADAANVPLLDALALRAHGAVQLVDGHPEDALLSLRRAAQILRDLSCPYDEAHAQLLAGQALAVTGDDASAHLEFAAAAATFERLGALLDVDRARSLLAGDQSLPHGLTAREAEVLALVARGKSNRDIAATLVISEHTVARHVSNIFRKIDVTSRSAAGAFAFEHRLA